MRITFLGAGSAGFTMKLLVDILSFPELSEADIALMDVDTERLDTAKIMAEKVVEHMKVPARVIVTKNRREALEGASYVFNLIKPGFGRAHHLDADIPQKYGLKQTIADTIGVGGVFRALRTIPVMWDTAKDMEELCPDALMLNYSNPMAMVSLAMHKYTKIKYIGLCHSVQGTASLLANILDVPVSELKFDCAGINHMAWFTKLEHKGQDLYPLLRQKAEDPDLYEKEPCRMEILKRTGFFHTEGSTHAAEYSPHFMRNEELIEKYNVKVNKFKENLARKKERMKLFREKLLNGEKLDFSRSHEFGVKIIHAIETDTPYKFYGNVLNHSGLVENLPKDCCVELACFADKNGIYSCYFGGLPEQCAIMNKAHINVHKLVLKALLEGNREHVYHALMVDPLTSCVLDLDKIWNMTEELLKTYRGQIPEFLVP